MKHVLAIIGGALVAASLAGGSAVAGGDDTASRPDSTVVYSGYDFSRRAYYSYLGVEHALNRDLGKDGFVLRAYGSFLHYEYVNNWVTVTGEAWQGDAMVGYHRDFGHFGASVFIGLDYQDYKLSPDDPTARVRGSEVGFKIAADLETDESQRLYFGLNGAYSTAFDTYWARVRAGLRHGSIVVGPEFIALGGTDYEAQRVGGFMSMKKAFFNSTLTISGGYQFVPGSNSGAAGQGSVAGSEGPYGAIGFSWTF